MKKNIILIFLLINYLFISSFISQPNISQDKIRLANKAVLLEKYYNKSFQNVDSIKYRILFFNEFPSNYNDFKEIYGYLGSINSQGILLDSSYEHIFLFFNLEKLIEKEKFILKTILISLNGEWQSDGVSYFQLGLQETIEKNLYLYCKLTTKFKDNEIKSFWFFLFDGPHPKGIPEEFKEIKNISPRIYKLMEESNKKVLELRKTE